jgi:sugar lactone lactonase YvrE
MLQAVEPLPFVDGIVYGEGPAGHVCSVGESGDVAVEVELEHASGLGWLPDGTLVVSTLFEAKVAPDGRAYVDLYQVSATGLTGLAVPNGLGFLPDESTLVVSETNGSRILAFPVEPDGSLGAPNIFADLGAERHPDGLCVDAEGAVWVGCYDTREFLRVVAGGTVTHRVAIDRGWAIAPALGGVDGRTLYMVIDDTTQEGLVRGESTGWIMQARVDVPGAGSP